MDHLILFDNFRGPCKLAILTEYSIMIMITSMSSLPHSMLTMSFFSTTILCLYSTTVWTTILWTYQERIVENKLRQQIKTTFKFLRKMFIYKCILKVHSHAGILKANKAPRIERISD